jgi:hypothetical protein
MTNGNGGPPITTEVGQDIYDAVEPLTYADESLGWPLATWVDCQGLMLDEEARLVRADDQGNDGWSAFADPARCPTSYLFTLAQWSGVRYPRRMSEADLRAIIGPHAPGLWRGTKAAIQAAVARYLTDDGQMFFEERSDGDAYHLRIFTYNYDTADEDSIRRELVGAVPAGLILEYEVRDGQSYAILRDGPHGHHYSDVKAAYDSYADLHASLPNRSVDVTEEP